MGADVATSGIDIEVLMASYIEDNTSQGKGWILDSDSTVHVCSHKDTLNSLVAKEEGTVKMVDGPTCEVISTRTVNVTVRYKMVRALEVIQYVLEAQYNLIFIGVLDEEGCQIQVQQGVARLAKETW